MRKIQLRSSFKNKNAVSATANDKFSNGCDIHNSVKFSLFFKWVLFRMGPAKSGTKA